MPEKIEKQLDKISNLLIRILVVKLYLGGTTMDGIARNLSISKKTVVELLKGVKKSKSHE